MPNLDVSEDIRTRNRAGRTAIQRKHLQHVWSLAKTAPETVRSCNHQSRLHLSNHILPVVLAGDAIQGRNLQTTNGALHKKLRGLMSEAKWFPWLRSAVPHRANGGPRLTKMPISASMDLHNQFRLVPSKFTQPRLRYDPTQNQQSNGLLHKRRIKFRQGRDPWRIPPALNPRHEYTIARLLSSFCNDVLKKLSCMI